MASQEREPPLWRTSQITRGPSPSVPNALAWAEHDVLALVCGQTVHLMSAQTFAPLGLVRAEAAGEKPPKKAKEGGARKEERKLSYRGGAGSTPTPPAARPLSSTTAPSPPTLPRALLSRACPSDPGWLLTSCPSLLASAPITSRARYGPEGAGGGGEGRHS